MNIDTLLEDKPTDLDTLKVWSKWVVKWVALIGVIVYVVARATPAIDTSPRTVVVTDEENGCQYLHVPDGGITPRLNGNHKHLGCRNEL